MLNSMTCACGLPQGINSANLLFPQRYEAFHDCKAEASMAYTYSATKVHQEDPVVEYQCSTTLALPHGDPLMELPQHERASNRFAAYAET